jgi:hypothetical protein
MRATESTKDHENLSGSYYASHELDEPPRRFANAEKKRSHHLDRSQDWNAQQFVLAIGQHKQDELKNCLRSHQMVVVIWQLAAVYLLYAWYKRIC